MVVLVTEIVYLGRRRVRACTGGNQGDTRVSEELENLFNERELAGGMMLQLMQDVNTRAQYEQSDAILEWEWDGRHPSCQHATRGHPGT